MGEAEGKEGLNPDDFWPHRRLVEFSPDGILISRDTRIVFLNPAAVRLFGASAPEQVLGKVLFVTGHADLLMETPRRWEGEAILEKPFTEEGLREAVSLLLAGQ